MTLRRDVVTLTAGIPFDDNLRIALANQYTRYPLVEAMLTPFGVIGGLRGVLFFNIGGSGFNNQSFKPFASRSEDIPPLLGFRVVDLQGNVEPVFGFPVPVSGLPF